MREFKLGDKIIHLPDTIQRTVKPLPNDRWHCACHVRLGNDYYFLPKGSCLRASKVCNNPQD